MARNLDDHAPHAVETATGSGLGIWQYAAADLREALWQAAEQVDAAAGHLDQPGQDRPDRCARHLAHAADAVTAGRDLLRSHTAADPGGVRAARSEWAPVLSSQPVVSALTRETARWSRRAGAMAQWLSSASGVHQPAVDTGEEAPGTAGCPRGARARHP
jgi:hypothetical protein